jgi:hypothetical protein
MIGAILWPQPCAWASGLSSPEAGGCPDAEAHRCRVSHCTRGHYERRRVALSAHRREQRGEVHRVCRSVPRQTDAIAPADTWRRGTEAASAEQREYTRDNYLRQLDGLTYNEVVRIPDPTGELAKRYRAEYYYARAKPRDVLFPRPASPWPERSPIGRGYTDSSRAEAMR